ncbi:hypothetical protein GDO81_024091 [Engystomops pustulosus]|uniref:Uncharacterized protein n=1 Tax=Engystomops pustulosus TaxID=76066 RepID=A0AAV6Z236_ENGPU|nr:hypothetical protein GDO81_024091 [Engystomops pustulosus]
MTDIREKIENYKTAPFDARFPNQNQTKHCVQNYLDFHRCEKADRQKYGYYPMQWYKRVSTAPCAPFLGKCIGRARSVRILCRSGI